MALAFSHLSWWVWSGKYPEPAMVSNGSSYGSSSDSGSRDLDNLKFPLIKGTANSASSGKRVRRKWHSREERKIDREYDMVVVPSDGGCVSGSESDGSDYSIGWLEPHAHGFHGDDEMDNSFAVLIRCYEHHQADAVLNTKKSHLSGVVNDPTGRKGNNR